MKIDLWYNNKIEEITSIDCFFYPNDGIYRGNLYINNRTVGDYSTDNSSKIDSQFPHLFRWS